MISRREPQENQYLTLVVEKGVFSGRYVSKMVASEDDKYIISAPIRNGLVVPFRENTLIKIEYFTRETLFEFVSMILGRRSLPAPTLVISKPTEINKIQRRRFVRIDDSIEVYYRVIGEIDALSMQLQPVDIRESGGAPIREQGMYEAVTRDISGGGFYLILREIQYGIMIRDTVLVKFMIPGTTKIIRAIGKIVRYDGPKEFKLDMRPGIVGMAVEFTAIDEAARDIIIQHIFAKQREMIRRMRRFQD